MKYKDLYKAKTLAIEGQELINRNKHNEGRKKYAEAIKMFLDECNGMHLSWVYYRFGEKKPYKKAELRLKKEAAELSRRGETKKAEKYIAEAELMRLYSEDKNEGK